MTKRPDFPRFKTHKFRDILFHIHWRRPKKNRGEMRRFKQKKVDVLGRSDPPTNSAPRNFYVAPLDGPEEILDTVLHESDHACFPDLDESAVQEHVASTMKFLKRMNMKISFGEKAA